MKKALFAAVAATIFVVVSPAFANRAYEAELDMTAGRPLGRATPRLKHEITSSSIGRIESTSETQ
jgi:hypothetical protein